MNEEKVFELNIRQPTGTDFLLCTQKVKDALEKSNYGSLALLEVGSIIE